MINKKAVRSIAVIGAGIMGRGIAHVSAMAGFTTVLNDVSIEELERAAVQIRRDLQKGVEMGKVESSAMNAALAQLSFQPNFEKAVTDADLVIEAVPEKIELKLDLFER